MTIFDDFFSLFNLYDMQDMHSSTVKLQ